jgi:hypothetical protein
LLAFNKVKRSYLAAAIRLHNTRRMRMKKLIFAIIAIAAIASFGFAQDYAPVSDMVIFTAALSGGESVPAVTTVATGRASFTLSKNGKVLKYVVKVKKIQDVTAAHIHIGKMGENGPPIALIKVTAKNTSKKFSGTLAKGSITDQELMTSYKGKTLADLITQIQTGNTYVNVHTKINPDGEIRGQLK